MNDDRAQSVVIGATFVFGILIISLSIYQAIIIPNQNKQIEIDHSQSVSDDISNVRTTVISLGEIGGIRSESVRLGTSYPSRIIGVNPPPPGGTLRTRHKGKIIFNKSFNSSELCGYEPTTRSLTYQSTYYEFQESPTIEYENTIVYRNYSDDYIIDSNQTLISETTISLVPLNRTYHRSGSKTVSLSLKAGPQGGATNESDTPITLTIPSRLPADIWEQNNELFGNVDAVRSVEEADEAKFPNSINVTLDDRLYTVRCRAVGIEEYPVSGQSVPLSLAGPVTKNVSVSPEPVVQGDNFDLKATITDTDRGGDQIETAQWRDLENESHTGGMSATDGKYDQTVEDVQNISIDTKDWAVGDHTIQVRGIDAAGNIGGWTNVTLTVESSAGRTLIQGIAYENGDKNLALYQYDTSSIHDSGASTAKGVGGILDWDEDGSVDDVAYRSKNKRSRIYNKSEGTTKEYSFEVASIIGFKGDFDRDGNRSEIPYLNGDAQDDALAVLRHTDSGVENIPVVDEATGEQITLNNPPLTQITGTRDVDRDGDPEFAYVNGNNDLVVAHITSVSTAEIRVRVQVIDETVDNDVTALGGIGDFDDDGFMDEIPIQTPTSYSQQKYIRYYDLSEDSLFLYEDTVPNELGPTLDTDGNGKHELYFVDGSGELAYREVGDSTVVTVTVDGNPISVGNDEIGGGN